MNRFLDLTERQLKFVVTLTTTALICGAFLLVKSYSTPADNNFTLDIQIGEPENYYTGLFVLDPNTAPADSLELIPGIGKELADRIVEYRQSHYFKRAVDITEIKGIGAKTYERIKPYLKIKKR